MKIPILDYSVLSYLKSNVLLFNVGRFFCHKKLDLIVFLRYFRPNLTITHKL